MKLKLSNYTPVPDRVVLERPVIEKETDKGIIKTEATIKAEIEAWIEDGKPLQVSLDYETRDGAFKIKKGEYVILSTKFGILDIEFEDVNRWQIPATSIAGKFKM